MSKKPVQPDDKQAKIFAENAEEIAKQERAVQKGIEAAEAKRGTEKESKPMQAGAREYPAPPFPDQHQAKPGSEADLELKPMYDAPDYKGSDKLKDKVALSPAAIPESAARSRCCSRAKAPTSRSPICRGRGREETKRAVEKEGRRCILIAGDVADAGFCRKPSRRTVADSAGSTSWSTTPRSRSTSTDRGPDRRALRPHDQDQPLRLLPHGQGGGAAHEAGARS